MIHLACLLHDGRGPRKQSMSESNYSVFTSSGMIKQDQLTESEKNFLNALTPEKVQQLVSMWKRLGQPKLPTDGDVVGFF